MIGIDSDCIIDFLRGKKEAIDVVKKYQDELVTTEINVFEIYYGIYINNAVKEEKYAEMFFNSLEVLNVNSWGAKAAKIFTDVTKQGKTIEQNDCLIASTLLMGGCNKIITKNVAHFSRIKEIQVLNY